MKRQFVIGSLTIDDPVPTGSLADAYEQLCHRFPQLRSTEIFESDAQVVDATTVKYVFPQVPAKVNG